MTSDEVFSWTIKSQLVYQIDPYRNIQLCMIPQSVDRLLITISCIKSIYKQTKNNILSVLSCYLKLPNLNCVKCLLLWADRQHIPEHLCIFGFPQTSSELNFVLHLHRLDNWWQWRRCNTSILCGGSWETKPSKPQTASGTAVNLVTTTCDRDKEVI